MNESLTRREALATGAVAVGSVAGLSGCLDWSDSRVQWTFEMGLPVPGRAMVVENLVYVASHDGFVRALTVDDGAEQWHFDTGTDLLGGPSVVGDSLYIGTYNGTLYAIDAETGTQQWRASTAGKITHEPGATPTRVVVGGDSVYSFTPDGDREWVFDRTHGYAAPHITEKRVIIGTAKSGTFALDVATGTLDWHVYESTYVTPKLTVAGDLVVIGYQSSGVVAVDRETGKRRWEVPEVGHVRARPMVVDGVGYVGGASGVLYAIDLQEGAVRWRHETRGPIPSTPTADEDGRILYFCSDQRVVAFDIQEQEEVWKSDRLGALLFTPPVLVEDGLLVSGGSEKLYKLSR